MKKKPPYSDKNEPKKHEAKESKAKETKEHKKGGK